MTLQELIVKIGTDVTDFVGGVDSAIGKAKEAESAFDSAGKILSSALTVPLAAVGAAALKAASDLQDASNIMRVQTGATGEALAALNESFKHVFADVPATAKDAGNAIAGLATRLNLSGKPLEDLSKQVLELAHITHTDLQPLIPAVTRVFGDWSIGTDKQGKALDYLRNVTTNTGIDITRLSQLVVEFGAPMRSLGFSFENAAVLLGRFEKEGVNIETVMPGLRRELGNFAKAGIDAAAGFSTVIEKIKSAKTESEGLTLAIQVFGQRAATDMFRAIKEGRFDIDAYTASVKASTDTIGQAAADTRTLGDEMKMTWNKVEIALQPLGQILKTALRAGFEDAKPLIDLVGELGRMFQTLPPGVQTAAVSLGVLAAAAGPATIATSFLLTSIEKIFVSLGKVGAAFGVTGEVAGAFGISVGSLAAVALPGLIAAITATVSNLEDLKRKWDEFADDARKEVVFGRINAGNTLDDLSKLGTKSEDLKKALQGARQEIDYSTKAVGEYGPTLKQLGATAEAVARQFESLDFGIKVILPPELQKNPQANKPNANADLSGIGKDSDKAILSLDQLIKKQAELEAAVRKAQFAFEALDGTYGQSVHQSDLVVKAEEQLAKAFKEAGNLIGEITVTLDLHNKKAQASQAVMDDLRARYKAGEISIGLFAEAHKALDQEMARANGGIMTSSQLVADLSDKHEILKAKADSAREAIQAIREKYGDTEQGVRLLADAHKQLDSAITATDAGYRNSSQALKDYADIARQSLADVRKGVEDGTKSLGDLMRAQDAARQANNEYRDSLSPLQEAMRGLGVRSMQTWRDLLSAAQTYYDTVRNDAHAELGDIEAARNALDNLKEGYREATDTIAQAFRAMNLKTNAELEKDVRQKQNYYNTIAGSGQAGAGTVEKAWEQAQEAQRRYNEALYGTETSTSHLGMVTQSVGRIIVQTFDEAIRQVTQFTAAVDQISVEAAKAMHSLQGIGDVNLQGVSGNSVSSVLSDLHNALNNGMSSQYTMGSGTLAGPGSAGYTFSSSMGQRSINYLEGGLPSFGDPVTDAIRAGKVSGFWFSHNPIYDLVDGQLVPIKKDTSAPAAPPLGQVTIPVPGGGTTTYVDPDLVAALTAIQNPAADTAAALENLNTTVTSTSDAMLKTITETTAQIDQTVPAAFEAIHKTIADFGSTMDTILNPGSAPNASGFLASFQAGTGTPHYIADLTPLVQQQGVTINNPTVLNRSMLDQIVTQLQNLGLGR